MDSRGASPSAKALIPERITHRFWQHCCPARKMCRAATGGPDAFRGTSMKQLILAVCAALALTLAVPADAAVHAPAASTSLPVGPDQRPRGGVS